MPIPAALLPPLIAGGSSLLGAGVQAVAQGKMNKKQRKWAADMYNLQRQHALEDWNRQNEYNSPQAAMERLKEAGINPRTYFTQGMTTEAGTVRASPVENWNPQVADWQGGIAAAGSKLMQYYDVQIKQAQIDNLKAQNDVLQQDALLKTAQAWKEHAPFRMAGDTESLDKKTMNLFDQTVVTSLEQLQQNLRKSKIEADVMLQKNEREAAQSAQSLQEGLERVLSLRLGRQLTDEQVKSIRSDNELKQLDIQLRKQFNIGPGDPLYVRLIALLLNKMGVKP